MSVEWTPDLSLIEKALDLLERREIRVLVWGLVDAAMSDDELRRLLEEVIATNSSLVNHPRSTIWSWEDRKRVAEAPGMISSG
jgi:hypothetical protein